MKPFQRLLVAAPAAALLPAVLAPASSLANEAQLNLDSVQGYSIAQATSIRDFSDVYPTDWAYQALSELVETYGCVSGFGDGSFRGQQPLTRFEMAAVLSSCLDSISAKVDAMGEEMKMSSMEDMDTLERLVASFEEELITLKGSVDGLDAKVSELEDSQFSTTTKASFEIATDFVYFASDDMAAKDAGIKEDNSGLALSSEVEIAFETSFTGSDTLSFSLTGDLMSQGNNYLDSGDFYGVAGDEGSADFGGFAYETNLDLGGMMTILTLGTDVNDLDPIVGLGTYYGGGGYDDFGPGDFGAAGIGFSVELLSSDVGALTASASYAIDGAAGADQGGEMGIFGEQTDRSGVLALSWEGALFGGNDALFTVAYQNILENGENDLTKGYLHLVAGAYFTDTISLSGSYSVGKWDYDRGADPESAQWMIGLNMDDAIFPGNSAGLAYGTPEFTTDPETDDVMQVLELYYTFSVNDNFEIPIYLDFISNVGHQPNADAFAIAVRPTLTF
ncbi:MAG: S-layer homology domain-containing protein [Synechococcus sp. SB0662_bin_14]|nr:S-layer homology domain-containing protein [Acidimicrobiia bacterium]MYC50049.1 S-layer homology domain-containing protein [Synechococcus sp. SB0662_bin_14]